MIVSNQTKSVGADQGRTSQPEIPDIKADYFLRKKSISETEFRARFKVSKPEPLLKMMGLDYEKYQVNGPVEIQFYNGKPQPDGSEYLELYVRYNCIYITYRDYGSWEPYVASHQPEINYTEYAQEWVEKLRPEAERGSNGKRVSEFYHPELMYNFYRSILHSEDCAYKTSLIDFLDKNFKKFTEAARIWIEQQRAPLILSD